jgi:uncharacterized membrane protein YhaH (DUF805 family)
VKWYLAVLKSYARFSGRARRTEFWMFQLVNLIISIFFSVLDRYVFHSIWPGYFYTLAMLVPLFAVGARRLHDSGRTGALVLIIFIPVLGYVALLVLAALRGSVGPNQYGPDPRQSVVAAV